MVTATRVHRAFAARIRDALAEDDRADGTPWVERLVRIREGLRAAKQWQLADRVRDGLGSLGIVLEDSVQGTAWKSE